MATPPPAVKKIYTGADSLGCSLKDSLLAHLKEAHPDIEVVDLGVEKYYSIAAAVGRRVSTSPSSSRGLLFCGTGVGVAIFANKFPSVYASVCSSPADAVNTRSINDSNVLCLSGASASPADAAAILDAWLATPFKAPCPASGNSPWPAEISDFLDASLSEMKQIPSNPSPGCAICCVRKNLQFDPVDIMPGAEMKIVRESPTSAIVKFKAGSVEPAHHHTFGHDVLVMKGRKKVWNVDKKEEYELEEGDYLFTPAGDVHRVKYFEDTEFFIRWDGDWDIFLDEDLEKAKAVIDKESNGSE